MEQVSARGTASKPRSGPQITSVEQTTIGRTAYIPMRPTDLENFWSFVGRGSRGFSKVGRRLQGQGGRWPQKTTS